MSIDKNPCLPSALQLATTQWPCSALQGCPKVTPYLSPLASCAQELCPQFVLQRCSTPMTLQRCCKDAPTLFAQIPSAHLLHVQLYGSLQHAAPALRWRWAAGGLSGLAPLGCPEPPHPAGRQCSCRHMS